MMTLRNYHHGERKHVKQGKRNSWTRNSSKILGTSWAYENIRLTNELAYTTERLNQALDLLKEMGADLDVMLATKIVFAEKPKPRHCECDIDDHKIGCQCRGPLMIPTKSRRWGQKGLPKK